MRVCGPQVLTDVTFQEPECTNSLLCRRVDADGGVASTGLLPVAHKQLCGLADVEVEVVVPVTACHVPTLSSRRQANDRRVVIKRGDGVGAVWVRGRRPVGLRCCWRMCLSALPGCIQSQGALLAGWK